MTTQAERIAAYEPHCKNFENTVLWLYLDTEGFVTFATGHMLPSASAACAHPFLGADDTLASDETITAAYLAVQRMEKGHTPAYYRNVTPFLTITQAAADEILSADLTYTDGALMTRLSGYEAMPLCVQLALMDMAFELGVSGLVLGYPKLLAACEAGQWDTAAAECHRNGPGVLRNAWTQKQFEAAK